MAEKADLVRSTLEREAWTASDWIDRFESDRRKLSRLDLASYFPEEGHPEFENIVAEILRAELEWRWSNGEWNGFSELVSELAWIVDRPAIISPLAFEDYRLALSHGQTRPREVYLEYSAVDSSCWDSWLDEAGNETGLVSTAKRPGATIAGDDSPSGSAGSGSSPGAAVAERFPKPPTQLGEFDLIAEIGSGAFSRVYIARQPALAQRLIVVKVTSRPFGESQRLARLQHGNIMPLYLAAQIRGYYVLGMPLLGATTLKDLLDFRLQQSGSGDRPLGADLIGACIAKRHQELSETVTDLPSLERRSGKIQRADQSRSGGVDVRAWNRQVLAVVQRLAEALDYSHLRGVQHRDIKPANILLGFDHQPLLLDFNLSHFDSPQERQRSSSIGGTLPYMSPEQLQAMLDGTTAIPDNSDVYSLGVVLYEALTGRLPHDFSTCRPNDIARAMQLRQQSVQDPQTFNPSISPAESAIVMKCLAVDPAKRYSSAAELETDIARHLNSQPLRFAANPSRRELFAKFRARNPRLCSLYSVLALTCCFLILAAWVAAQWHASVQAARAEQSYLQFVDTAHAAEAELYFADGGSRAEGQRLAAEAISIFAAAQAGGVGDFNDLYTRLDADRRATVSATSSYLSRLSQSNGLDGLTFNTSDSATGMERATEAYFSRRYRDAIALLDKELEINADRFAAWFLKGKCHFEQREYRDADRCYAMAAMLEPDSELTLVSRGICHYWMSEHEQAIAFFKAALEVAPDSFAANYNLALVHERQRNYDKALEQLERADRLKPGSTRVLMSRSRIARAAGDSRLAEETLREVLAAEPAEPEGWILRGLARVGKDPEGALGDFRRAAEWPETRFISHQNQAHVLSEILGRPQDAIEVLDILLAEFPEFQPALSGRAVLHARQGNREAALRDVNRLLAIAVTPQLHYQAACVYALLSAKHPELRRQALYHLSIASAPAYGSGVIATDKDLKNLHGEEQYQALLKGIMTTTELSRQKPETDQ